jgi:hypothetical protein
MEMLHVEKCRVQGAKRSYSQVLIAKSGADKHKSINEA